MRKIHHLLVVVVLLTGTVIMLAPASATAQIAIGVSVRIGPPPLRVVAMQPLAPGPGYFWTPGYWAYGPAGYYWVPGAWVLAPGPGLLWTPGYWGFADGMYLWHGGYWGRHVGFYGGINYGFGYFGTGFAGGYWRGRQFFYNTAVWRVNRTVVHTTYVDRTVIRNVQVNRVSYNGGPHGVRAHASTGEMRYAQEHHVDATAMQTRHEFRARAAAGGNRGLQAAPTDGQGRNRGPQAERHGQERPHAQGKAKNDKQGKGERRGPGGSR